MNDARRIPQPLCFGAFRMPLTSDPATGAPGSRTLRPA
jgi:hypothetical protein